MSIDLAAATLRRGGVIVYPTEGVFGIGCLPGYLNAVQRILDIKRRDAAKGLILIAANAAHFDAWINLPERTVLPEADESRPITWIVPANDNVDPIVRGEHDGLAVRLTGHPIARAICETLESPIVSTSANLSGEPAAEDHAALRRQFGGLVDYIVPGDCGPSLGPSEIRVLATGEILRPHQ